MKVDEVKKFIDHAPATTSDITFAIDADEFAELQFDCQQYHFKDMVILYLTEKVTIFKRK